MTEASLLPVSDRWIARWLAGGPPPDAADAPPAWRDALAADDELAWLALATQWRQCMLDPELPADAVPGLPIPAPRLALLPDALRLRFRRFARGTSPALLAGVLRALAHAGHMAHPFDWRPEPELEGLPPAYDDWRRWAAAQEQPTTPAQGRDDLALLPTAERRRAFAQWRGEDPDAARDALPGLLAPLGAEQRLGLVEQLATRLSSADLPLLRQLDADRSDRVRLVATRLRARLGETEALDDATREALREWFEVGRTGLIQRRTTVKLKPLKTQTQRSSRRERLAATAWPALAAVLGLDETTLADAWVPADEDDPSLLDSLAQTAAQDVVARTLDRLLFGELSFAGHAPIWGARETMLQRVGAAARATIVARALRERSMFRRFDELPPLLEAPLAGIDVATLRRGSLWTSLETELREHLQSGPAVALAPQLAALAAVLGKPAARALLQHLTAEGLSPADPMLDPLVLVAECPDPTSTQASPP